MHDRPPHAAGSYDFAIGISGHEMLPLASGALYWPEMRALLVADLHLEKGAAYARRGQMLPPYDTIVTLRRLERVIAQFSPRLVIALGDSFHTSEVAETLAPRERSLLARLQRGRDWVWIGGNHDPALPASVGGSFVAEVEIGGLALRHEPGKGDAEIAGHLHPVASIARQGESIRRKCFASDGNRLILPAFGAYAGGLDILGRAFAGLFDRQNLAAWLMGRSAVYPVFGRALFGG